MTRRCLPICPCAVGSSSCIVVSGSGNTDDPFIPAWNLSPDAGNELEITATGLRHLLPTELARRPAARLGALDEQSVPNLFPVALEWTSTYSDTAGFLDPNDNTVLVIPRSGAYSVGTYVRVSAGEENDDGAGDGTSIGLVSLQINGLRRIASEGPRLRENHGPLSNITTIYPFEEGDRIQAWYEPQTPLNDVKIREDCHIYITYRGSLDL